MHQPSATFTDDLTGVIDDLVAVDRRLRSLFDMAGYEELAPAVGQRLRLKANGIEVQRSGLEEIVEGKVS